MVLISSPDYYAGSLGTRLTDTQPSLVPRLSLGASLPVTISRDLIVLVPRLQSLTAVKKMLLVLTEEHKEHLGFLTRVDVEGELLTDTIAVGGAQY